MWIFWAILSNVGLTKRESPRIKETEVVNFTGR